MDRFTRFPANMDPGVAELSMVCKIARVVQIGGVPRIRATTDGPGGSPDSPIDKKCSKSAGPSGVEASCAPVTHMQPAPGDENAYIPITALATVRNNDAKRLRHDGWDLAILVRHTRLDPQCCALLDCEERGIACGR